MRPEDDAERDAWLREALRHAPDAALGPPPALSEAILREARSATAATPAATTAGRVSSAGASRPNATWLEAAWAWLARPSVAAGFASILAATLVGMLWWDRPLDDALPRPPDRIERPAAAPPGQRPESPTPSAPAAPPAKKDARDAAAPTIPPQAAVVEPPDRDHGAAERKAAPATPAPDESVKSKAEATAKERAAVTSSERQDAPRPEPFPATTEPPAADRLAAANATKAPRDEPDADTRAAAEGSAQVARSADRSEPPRRQAAAPSGMPGAATEPSAAAAANAGRLRGMAKAAASPLAALRGAVAAEPQRWSWQLDGQTPRPIGPALLRWLEHVDAAFAGGRPDAAFAPAPQGAAPATAQGAGSTADAGLTLRLLRDGSAHTTLRIGSDDVQVEDAETGTRRTGVPAASATALKAEIAAAAR